MHLIMFRVSVHSIVKQMMDSRVELNLVVNPRQYQVCMRLTHSPGIRLLRASKKCQSLL